MQRTVNEHSITFSKLDCAVTEPCYYWLCYTCSTSSQYFYMTERDSIQDGTRHANKKVK